MPKVELLEAANTFLAGFFKEMIQEFNLNDSSLEEMVRTYLKQLIISATRSWKRQHLTNDVTDQQKLPSEASIPSVHTSGHTLIFLLVASHTG